MNWFFFCTAVEGRVPVKDVQGFSAAAPLLKAACYFPGSSKQKSWLLWKQRLLLNESSLHAHRGDAQRLANDIVNGLNCGPMCNLNSQSESLGSGSPGLKSKWIKTEMGLVSLHFTELFLRQPCEISQTAGQTHTHTHTLAAQIPHREKHQPWKRKPVWLRMSHGQTHTTVSERKQWDARPAHLSTYGSLVANRSPCERKRKKRWY